MSEPAHAKAIFLRYPDLKKRIPWSRQYLSRLEKVGKFPRRVQVGENTVAWIEGEVDAWINARAAKRGSNE